MRHQYREVIDNYINGNRNTIREEIKLGYYSISDLLNEYIEDYNPNMNDVLLFVKALETK